MTEPKTHPSLDVISKTKQSDAYKFNCIILNPSNKKKNIT